MKRPWLVLKIIANRQGLVLVYGCPNCQKIFCSGYFAIELVYYGENENKLVCDTRAGSSGLVNCCQETFPVPLVFNHRADAEKFIDDAKNGRITEICLTSLEFVTKI